VRVATIGQETHITGAPGAPPVRRFPDRSGSELPDKIMGQRA